MTNYYDESYPPSVWTPPEPPPEGFMAPQGFVAIATEESELPVDLEEPTEEPTPEVTDEEPPE